MEILPIDKITEDLAALAELRAQIRNLEKIVDDGLMEFDLYLFRSYGDTGYEFRMSELTAQAISLLDASRQSILKDGLIGQLELKAGIVKPLEEEQYHEKILQTEEALESMLYADEKEEERQKQKICFRRWKSYLILQAPILQDTCMSSIP